MAKLTITDAAHRCCVARSTRLPRRSHATTRTATQGAADPGRPRPHGQPRVCRVYTPPARERSGGAGMGLHPTLVAHRWLSRPAAHGHRALAGGGPSGGDAAHGDRRHGPSEYAPLLSGARLSGAGALPSLERGMSDDSRRPTVPGAYTAGGKTPLVIIIPETPVTEAVTPAASTETRTLLRLSLPH